LIEILFEDEWLVAANKFSGIPIHQTIDKFRPHFQGQLEKQLGVSLVLFHRLDVDTSGVVLFGKDKSANKAITDLFRNREIQKTYDVIVEGAWPSELDEVSGFIKESSQKKGKYFLDNRGRSKEKSRTRFKLESTFLKNNKPNSYIQAFPETGRTHQIRVHCAFKGFPICGDRLYGKPDPRGLPLALHAKKLEFLHPLGDQKKISILAPQPESFSFWLSAKKI
jgi:23S rRNA pseudouridine955/2504/2580 synthase